MNTEYAQYPANTGYTTTPVHVEYAQDSPKPRYTPV